MLKTPLAYRVNSFHCPHCEALAEQEWFDLAKGVLSESGIGHYQGFIPDMFLSLCSKCQKNSLWLGNKIIYPVVSIAPKPAVDMPIDVKEEFLEARKIVSASPRAAAAILRIGLQKLMIILGGRGNNIEVDVSRLIRKGLPERVLDALYAVNAIGVNKVLPGEINYNESVHTALALFDLLNMIVELSISQQKKVDLLCVKLPHRKSSLKSKTKKRRKKSNLLHKKKKPRKSDKTQKTEKSKNTFACAFLYR